MKVKTYHVIDSNEFDALVKVTYGEHVKYEFVADEEAHNYTAITYNNMERGKALDEWDFAKLVSLKTGHVTQFMAQILIQDMVNTRVLDPGNYMIEVYW